MKTTQFENLLKAAERRGTLTQSGITALTQLLDPFHDEPFGAVGFPDAVKGNSVVRTVPSTFNVAIPSGAATAFDVHIFTFPEVCQWTPAILNSRQHVGDVVGAWLLSDGITPMKIGLFNIIAVPAGQPSLPTNASYTAGFHTYPAGTQVFTSNFSSLCTGNSRLIACAYKTCNTSPELVASGSAIHYRLPCHRRDSTWFVNSFAAVTGAYPAGQYIMPPCTAEEALSISDAQTTDAKEGNYMVSVFHSKPEARYCRYEPLFVLKTDAPNTLNNTWARADYNGPAPISLGFARLVPFTCVRDAGIDITGSYYINLAAGSSLQVTARVMIETFPAIGDDDLLLASPSPADDEVIWDMYQRIAKRFPNNALFHDNDSGGWWDLICSIGTAAAILIPHPLAGAIKPVLGAVRAVTESDNRGNGVRVRGTR